LIGKLTFNNSIGGVGLDLGYNVSGLLELSSGFVGLLNLFLVKLDIVLLEIELSEWIGINGDNAVFNDGLGSDELIVGSVINNIQNSSLSCDRFRSPGEISGIIFQGSKLRVSTSGSNLSNSLWSQFGHRCLSSHLELSLLLMDWHTSTS